MSSPAKKVLITLGAVLAVIATIFLVFLFTVRASLPQTRGTLTAKGLDAAVEVLRDRNGVPHIRATTMHDLYFAQGYIMVQDRFWQMDFWRRIGSGRLSEIFGKSTLGTDMYLRTVGFRRIAEQEYRTIDRETRTIFDSYAEGVNAYVLGRPPRKLGLEYVLLSLQGVHAPIEPWTTPDSLTWLKIMAQDLGANMRREMYSMDIIQQVGLPGTRDFFGSYRYGEMPVIVSDSEMPRQFLLPTTAGARERASMGPRADGAAAVIRALPAMPRVIGGLTLGAPLAMGNTPGLGSNNWVISGSRTVSGKPILANDPHLGIQMPSIWYEADLYCSAQEQQPGKNAGGPFHVAGFTFAGTPGIVIGHNDRIAWGVTNLNPDVQDLYIEKVNPENPNQYEVNGHWVDMSLTQEQITVLHQDDPAVILARQTRHGPVITDVSGFAGDRGFTLNPGGAFPMNLELRVLSLRWTALQTNSAYKSVALFDRARNFDEFREALRNWDVPSRTSCTPTWTGTSATRHPGSSPSARRGAARCPHPAGRMSTSGRASSPSTASRSPTTRPRDTSSPPTTP